MRSRLNATILGMILLLPGCGDDPAQPQGASPEFSLMFEAYFEDSPELAVLDPATGEIQRPWGPAIGAGEPSTSPDGKSVLYSVQDLREWTGDIFRLDQGGTAPTLLTDSPYLDDRPAWSPDGGWVAFRSFRSEGSGDIWTMSIDGGDLKLLTPDPLPAVTEEDHPAWSPDGSLIAYACNANGTTDIWVMNRDGAGKRFLTDHAEFETEPAWSPDGRTIAFRRGTLDTTTDLCLVPAEGGEVTVLPLPGIQRLPVWDPSGARLVFVHQPTRFDRPDLYSMTVAGEDLRALVTDAVPGGCLNPAFIRK
ncbi:MAG: TolB family protein [Candidatus Krumholzibacteriia bacterium]